MHIYREKQTISHEDVSATREHVQNMRAKLDEIYSWYEENLKGPPQSHASPRQHSRSSHESGSFVLCEEGGTDGRDLRIVCPHARLEDLWMNDSESPAHLSERNIFKCGCSSTTDFHNIQYSRKLDGSLYFTTFQS